MMPVPDSNNHVGETQDYKQKYKSLKRKLKFLLYEQEYFQENLRKSQKKLLRVSRDKSFLLDRLLQYEQVEPSSSDEDDTASSSEASDEGAKILLGETSSQEVKSKKSQPANHNLSSTSASFTSHSATGKATTSRSTAQSSSKLVPCKFSGDNQPCQEFVSKRSKSGYCSAHRTVVRITKQGISKNNKSATNEPTKDEQVEQLESLHCTASHVPQATEQLPHDVFNMEDDEPESENEDSPGSAGFQYEGDDDLVIDLPE